MEIATLRIEELNRAWPASEKYFANLTCQASWAKAWLSGPQAWLARSRAWLDGPEWGDEQTYGWIF